MLVLAAAAEPLGRPGAAPACGREPRHRRGRGRPCGGRRTAQHRRAGRVRTPTRPIRHLPLGRRRRPPAGAPRARRGHRRRGRPGSTRLAPRTRDAAPRRGGRGRARALGRSSAGPRRARSRCRFSDAGRRADARSGAANRAGARCGLRQRAGGLVRHRAQPAGHRARPTSRRAATRTDRPAACSAGIRLEPRQRCDTTVARSRPAPRATGHEARAGDLPGRILGGPVRRTAQRRRRRARGGRRRSSGTAPGRGRGNGCRPAAGRAGRAQRRLRHGNGAVPSRPCGSSRATKVSPEERLRWLWQGCVVALEMWDDESAYRPVARQRADRPGDGHAQRAGARAQRAHPRARLLRRVVGCGVAGLRRHSRYRKRRASSPRRTAP